jgi:BirA family biotin operon repressor/biotin-[acetyl-CoA-carboxylase] ligase
MVVILTKVTHLRSITCMKALIIDKAALWLEEIPSTNAFVLEQCRKGQAVSGMMVAAHRQTAGRGQWHASWLSAPGASLACSFALDLEEMDVFTPDGVSGPSFLPITRLHMAIALGAFDYLKLRNMPQPNIKWPNDLVVNETKVGGILTESFAENMRVKWLVVGIGLNLHIQTFPPHLPHAASLSQFSGHTYQPAIELTLLTDCLNQRLKQWQTGPAHKLIETYYAALIGFETWRRFKLPEGDWFSGRILGVTSEGHLKLEADTGEVLEKGVREIVWDWRKGE